MEIPNSGCPAHLDFGVSFIDSDFFVAYRTNNGAIVSIEDLFLEITQTSKVSRQDGWCNEIRLTGHNHSPQNVAIKRQKCSHFTGKAAAIQPFRGR